MTVTICFLSDIYHPLVCLCPSFFSRPLPCLSLLSLFLPLPFLLLCCAPFCFVQSRSSDRNSYKFVGDESVSGPFLARFLKVRVGDRFLPDLIFCSPDQYSERSCLKFALEDFLSSSFLARQHGGHTDGLWRPKALQFEPPPLIIWTRDGSVHASGSHNSQTARQDSLPPLPCLTLLPTA